MKAVFVKGTSAVSVDDVKVPDLASTGDVLVKMRGMWAVWVGSGKDLWRI